MSWFLWSLLVNNIYQCVHMSKSFGLNRYTIIKEVGDGTFGSVWRAINKQIGEVVSSVFMVFSVLKLKGINYA